MMTGDGETVFLLGVIAIVYLIYKNSKEKKPAQKESSSDSDLYYDPVYETSNKLDDSQTISQEIDDKIQKSSTEQTWKIVAIVLATLFLAPVLLENLGDVPDLIEEFTDGKDEPDKVYTLFDVEDAVDKVTSDNNDELLRLEFVGFCEAKGMCLEKIDYNLLKIEIYLLDVGYDCTNQFGGDCFVKEYSDKGQDDYYYGKNCETDDPDGRDRYCIVLMENGVDICDAQCTIKLDISYKGKAVWDPSMADTTSYTGGDFVIH